MKELCKAMAEAFPEIVGAIKDKENPHFKSKYADLGNVINAIKPALASRGLWFTQTIHSVPGCAAVETVIMHSSGESMSCGVVTIPVLKMDAQGYGSALTYARRYSLSAAFGVAPEDDDGNGACVKPPESNESTKQYVRQHPKKAIEQQPKIIERLSESEIVALARRVAVELMEDGELDSIVDEDEMAIYLASWQTKKPLHPMIDHLLSNDKPKLLSSFNSWLSRQGS